MNLLNSLHEAALPGDVAAETAGAWTPPLTEADAAVGQISDFLFDFSVETTPGEVSKTESFGAYLPPATRVYIAFIPGTDYGRVVEAAKRLRHDGMVPVPHVAARSTPNAAWLDEQLARLTGEAGVDQVLVVGGGVDRPIGDFDNSMQVLQTGLLEKHGIGRIGLAAHPEGSQEIGDAGVSKALADKNAYAEQSEATFYLVTQFCFEAAPIIAWDKTIREAGNRLPVHIGLPVCATLKTLIRYAALCGVGNSARVLSKQAMRISRLAKTATPDKLVLDLARHRAENPDCGIRHAHFFPFGALERTASWARAGADGNLAIRPKGKGFTVAGFD